MSKEKESYDVGFGKPPASGQFQPGQSGNPNGRPKKIKSIKALLEKELGQTVRVKRNGVFTTMTVREAFVYSLVSSAIKGDRHARQVLLAQIGDELDADDFKVNSEGEAMLLDFIKNNTSETGDTNHEQS